MHNNSQERYFEFTLLALILLLGYAIISQTITFLNGILGAVTLYIMLRRTNFYLARKTSPQKASWIITLTLSIFILIPISLIVLYIVDLAQNIQNFDTKILIERISTLDRYVHDKIGFTLFSEKSLGFVSAQATKIANMLLSGINNFAINLFTAILLLFFLLAGGFKMERYIKSLLPFSENNKKEIIKKINLIVRSNAIGIPLLALMQGVVAYIGYLICGVNNPLFFGVLTGAASIIPIVGTMIVWIPLCIIQYFEQSLFSTISLLVYCIAIISQCDNVLRMFLQKKMANTHPLITIGGVIVGIPLFGFMGVIFGPLIVAMFLLLTDMFAKQYILHINDKTKQNQ